MKDTMVVTTGERCRTGVHDFSMLGPASREPGCEGADFKVARCWYCCALSPNAQAKLAAFRAAKEAHHG